MGNKKIVCLGGGIGTVNLIKGLKDYTTDITVVVSMADEGGSSGRLRRMYNIFPPGDLVSCMASLCNDPQISQLLTYRFPGDRYGRDGDLAGHKLGNLIMVALSENNKDFESAIASFQKIFNIEGEFLPATLESVSISAKTTQGKIVRGEENIDLGKYNGQRVLEEVYLKPRNAKANPKVIKAIEMADVVIVGPGDLYTTLLPVLIVPQIGRSLVNSAASKLFVINVANKPFETKGYSVLDYIKAVKKHLGAFPFSTVITNDNFSIPIPKEFNYTYVEFKDVRQTNGIAIRKANLVNEEFPLYHDSQKLAKAIVEAI